MTVHAIISEGKKQLTNDVVFNCSREELLAIIEKYKIDAAANYNMMVAIPPKRETTKSGLIHLSAETSELEEMRNSIGRMFWHPLFAPHLF